MESFLDVLGSNGILGLMNTVEFFDEFTTQNIYD